MKKSNASLATTPAKPLGGKARSAVAMFPATVRFEYLNETPGAWRYQEHSAEGTPLVNDADGAKVGALYLRKASFPVAPKSIVVTIVE